MIIIDKKYRLVFWSLTAIFLITYVAMIVSLLQKKGYEKQREKFDRKIIITQYLKKDIGFSTAQLQQFDSLSSLYQKQIKFMYDSTKAEKELQFKLLAATDFNDSSIINAAEKSARVRRNMEIHQLKYIKSIRQLCTPNQIKNFDTSYIKIFNRRGNNKNRQ